MRAFVHVSLEHACVQYVSVGGYLFSLCEAMSDREDWLDDRELKAIPPGMKPVAGPVVGKALGHAAGPELGPGLIPYVIPELQRPKAPILPKPPIKVRSNLSVMLQQYHT